jgi:hypothetical protein
MLARSESRGKAKVRVLAVHTTEGISRAAALRDWTGWAGSSHAAADETGVLLAGAAEGFVDYDRASWTLRSGNPWSENIELCGFAKWKRGDWLARPMLLDACARWLATRSKARGIPLVKLSPKEYAAGGSGVIGHNDHTVGYSDGTHWDPGPDFPWDVVLDKARAYAAGTTTPEDDDMPYGDWPKAHKDLLLNDIKQWAVQPETVARRDDLSGYLETRFAEVRALITGGTADVDEQALAVALAPVLAANVGALSDGDIDRISVAVADEQARRQAS